MEYGSNQIAKEIKSVLVVEDDPTMRYLAEIIFSEIWPFEKMDFSCNGLEALKQVQLDGFPDMIIVDIAMPRMNGFELLDEFMAKYKEQIGKTTIVILTSFDRLEERDRMDNYNIVSKYMVKPLTKEKAKELMLELSSEQVN